MSTHDTTEPERTARLLAVQDRLAELGLHDLQARWEMQPDRQILMVGEGQQAEQTIPGNPKSAFHGVAVYNNTGHTLTLGFNSSAAIGSPIIVPPHSLLVWPAEYTNLSIAGDVTRPAESVVALRLRYPPGAPAIYELLQPFKEPWSEEEQTTAGTVKLKLAARPGRKIIVNSVIAMVSNTGAVANTKILEGSIKSGGNTIFRFNLLQSKTEGAGGVDRFTSGPIALTLKEGEELVIEVTGAEANAQVIVDASGYIE